jgi:hypothetical protein
MGLLTRSAPVMSFPNALALGWRPAVCAKAHYSEGGDASLFDRLLRVMDEKMTARKETKARARAETRDKNDRLAVFAMSQLRA